MTDKILKVVESSFDLNKHGRSDGNNRNYLKHTVKAMFESARTQEGLKLGELYGYFGHQRRQMANKLRPSEVEVVMLEGKPVVIENVPSNRTIELNLDESGIVTHKEQIFATPSGQIVNAMLESSAGGWSWAVTGAMAQGGARARDFHGFDYVNQPSYIDTERMTAMFESAGVDSQEQLINHNLTALGIEDTGSLLQRWKDSSVLFESVSDLNAEVLMLEGLLEDQAIKSSSAIDEVRVELNQIKEERESFKEAMFESLEAMPFMLTDEQKLAFTQMKTEHDRDVVKALFESIAKSNVSGLPNRKYVAAPLGKSNHVDTMDQAVIFTAKQPQFK